ncbi:hypothetical protein [Uliginosibacterium sp. 31-12]|uniref:hypothetical protein n=1 Tax=Uliginosibacterium sp. 31-12 TaxID=3062781 RepID=UPI0026E3E8EA|nr:hypothetical protein [Uliginosibacterium sp. 31-12]
MDFTPQKKALGICAEGFSFGFALIVSLKAKASGGIAAKTDYPSRRCLRQLPPQVAVGDLQPSASTNLPMTEI